MNTQIISNQIWFAYFFLSGPNQKNHFALGHSVLLCINISSVVEFQRWWVLKSKLFGQESTCHQGKIFKNFLRVMTVCQKVPKSYFQSQFWMSKIDRIFSNATTNKFLPHYIFFSTHHHHEIDWVVLTKKRC